MSIQQRIATQILNKRQIIAERDELKKLRGEIKELEFKIEEMTALYHTRIEEMGLEFDKELEDAKRGITK